MSSRRPPIAPLLVAALVTALGAGAPLAQPVSRGPYVQRPAPDGVVIVWEHAEPAAPVLRWGPTDELTERWEPAAPATRHEARLEGLPAGQTFHYALEDADGTLLAEPSTFPTAAAPGTPFRFVIFGDTRTRQDVHANVVTALGAEPDLNFYVNTGDLVSSGEVAEEWDEFFAVEQPVMSRLPLYPTIGNHDEEDRAAPLYVANFVLPDGGPAPEHYYSFDSGNVHVVVLDGHVHSEPWIWCITYRDQWTDTCFDDGQLEWLQADLPRAAQDPAIDHIIVVNHIGPYSSKDGRVGSGQMRELLPYFRELGVTLVVSGHDHYYERGTSGNGIPYIITGGGGAPLYDITGPSPDPHEVVYNESVENYLLVAVDGPLMHIVAKTPDGRLLDELTIDATPECVVDDACAPVEPTAACPRPAAVCSPGGRCTVTCAPDPGGDVVEAAPDAGGGADVAGGPDVAAGAPDVAVAPDAAAPAADVPAAPADVPLAAGPDGAAPPADVPAPGPAPDLRGGDAAAAPGGGGGVEGGGGCAATGAPAAAGPGAAGLALVLLLAAVLARKAPRRRRARARLRPPGSRH